MNCAEKIEFVDWDKRFSEANINTIKEVLLDMVREHRNFKLLSIDGVEYELVQKLTTCDECSPNEWGEAHCIFVEVLESSTEICMFRHYKCGVRWMYDVGAMEKFLSEV